MWRIANLFWSTGLLLKAADFQRTLWPFVLNGAACSSSRLVAFDQILKEDIPISNLRRELLVRKRGKAQRHASLDTTWLVVAARAYLATTSMRSAQVPPPHQLPPDLRLLLGSA